MSDTAFILGAGFSFDAGIPLLGNFVDRMWEYGIRHKTSSGNLSAEDRDIFQEAMKIRGELDGYHGRAMFDDRNIEDILSILSFNQLAGTSKDRHKLQLMSKAIARTIDLSCSVRHPGLNQKNFNAIKDGPEVYRNFWQAIFDKFKNGKAPPTLITFNYDLILERALLQTLVGTNYGPDRPLSFKKIKLNYQYSLHKGGQYLIHYKHFYQSEFNNLRESYGTSMSECEINEDTDDLIQINYLKLHGSLNFPRKRGMKQSLTSANLTNSLDDPLILPPVFNKMSNEAPLSMWQFALEKLRVAKNIVIVGYSLPQTDIYMQYFLKAALGPNLDLNKVFVFDPILFSETSANEAMRARYEACFSPQIRNRIVFNPTSNKSVIEKGTTAHFVDLLENSETELIF